MKSLATLILLLCGCENTAEATVQSSNASVNVERLFEIDGCTIYRFHDWRNHYFARCVNSSSISEAQTEHCGKSCARTVSEEIPTVYGGAK